MYDYIIIGAGTAGCVLANRLSADPQTRVLLIEAGPKDNFELIHTPGAFGFFMFSKKYDWCFEAKPDPAVRHGQPVFCPRGKTLGGSSSINGMVYTRGHSTDYDEWAQLGNPGWGYEDVLPYFRKTETNARGADRYHGANGPLYVSDSELNFPISKALIQAAEQAGMPMSNDFNGEQYEGFGPFQFTIRDGRRCSAAVAYLTPVLDRKNLTVKTEADVVRIEFEGKRAVGVTFDDDGTMHTVRANREVILSAGAYCSPQLLMLSGVGAPEELAKFQIETVHALPGVGRNLQEHFDAAVLVRSKDHGGISITSRGAMQMTVEGVKYYGAHLGKLRSSVTEAGGFLKTDPSLPKPDVQFHTVPLLFDDSGRDLKLMMQPGYSMHVCCLRPKSRGSVYLDSANPAHAPVIDHNYFSDPYDLQCLVDGVKLARRILASPALDAYRIEEMHPGPDAQSDAQIAQAVKDKLGIVYHPVGTCKMGPAADAGAVVDARLRVHGLQGLRVVDASIMPTLVGSNTNAPTFMIAEKAADMILADAAA